jgi:hypothetical protein
MLILLAAIDFPPPVPASSSVWPIHLAGFVLCAGAVAGVLLRSARPARAIDLLIWLILAPTGAFVFELSTVGRDLSEHFRFAVAGFVAVTAMTGFVVTALRLYQKQTRPRVAFAGGCLLAFNLLTLTLAPATPSARATARRTVCKNNLHNIGIALWEYVDLHKSLPAPVTGPAETPRSWRVELLPWIDQQPLRDRYDDEDTWNSPSNLDPAKTIVQIYRCPSHYYVKDDAGRAHTSYAAMTASNAAFSDAIRAEFPKAVTDGSSNTLMLVEACGQQIVWTEPRDLDSSKLPIGINLDGESSGHSDGIASSYHTGGAHVALVDGAIRFLSQNIDPATLKALTTASGNEKIEEF